MTAVQSLAEQAIAVAAEAGRTTSSPIRLLSAPPLELDFDSSRAQAPRDLFLPLEDTKANFDAFLGAGGKAVWYNYKSPEDKWDGHEIDQMPQLWDADMEAYLAERGLPYKRGN